MESNHDRLAGGALAFAALAAMLVMAHHPTSAHAAVAGRAVHGAMIALTGLIAYGFAHAALRRGIGRPDVLAGLIAWGIAIAANIGAATISGFVMTALAAKHVGHEAIDLAWAGNQALAGLGVAATGAALLLWSPGLLRLGGWGRALGMLGIAAGAVPAAMLGVGLVWMNLAGALLVYGIHFAWIALFGLWLWSGRFAKALG